MIDFSIRAFCGASIRLDSIPILKATRKGMASSQSTSETKIGYNKLAILFDNYDDLAIFRSFNELGAKNLLYMQAELLRLAQKLENQIEYDFHAEKADAEDVANYWRALEDSPEGCVGYRQRQIILEIREKLKRYCKSSPSTTCAFELTRIQTKLCSRQLRSKPSRNPRLGPTNTSKNGLQEPLKGTTS